LRILVNNEVQYPFLISTPRSVIVFHYQSLLADPVFPEDCDLCLRDLLDEMQMEERVKAAGPIMIVIS
jgi:hypothetical protein